MAFNHLVLLGGGHTNVLLLKKWLMNPEMIPECPISIISRESHLVYSAMFPSVISKSIIFNEALIDINLLANQLKINFIKEEASWIDFKREEIFFRNRPKINFSSLVLNVGSQTKIIGKFAELVRKNIACPIKPFLKAYDFIALEDNNDKSNELPFVIVGSGLAAVEVAFALRKRWPLRKICLVCEISKIRIKFLNYLKESNIDLRKDINFEYKKILLCTGNNPHQIISDNILNLDKKGRIIINEEIKVKDFSNLFAVGDCAAMNVKNNNYSSGLFAVKVVNTLAKNIKESFENKGLKRWQPQKNGLQIVNYYTDDQYKAFAIYSDFVFGPSRFFWELKNFIDRNFVKKFKSKKMGLLQYQGMEDDIECRGCAAKISQKILNQSLRDASLNNLADFPEDTFEIYRNNNEIILQSVDGFPALITDPWLNAKITTLHACSDLWASGVRISSAQALISIPRIDKHFQQFLFSQTLDGIKSTLDDLGGRLIGGHTFESRSDVKKPYSLDIEIALTVQGILVNEEEPWKKEGMKPGDVLLMSRPLGVGLYFAGLMQNINSEISSSEIYSYLIESQQYLIENILILQNSLGSKIINAATDVTGYGFLGHLKEMIDSSNATRIRDNMRKLKVILDLNSFKAYSGVFDLIDRGISSSLFKSNKEIFAIDFQERFKTSCIQFTKNKQTINYDSREIKLLLDPQTCGPILISVPKKYEFFLQSNWYKVGEVVENNF